MKTSRRMDPCRRFSPRTAGLRLLAILMLAAAAATGSDDGGGRSVFAIGAGNRALALGGAYAAVADDPSAALWNPAGLGLLQRKELQLTQTTLFGLGFSEQYASLALPDWRRGTLAATWRRFGVGGIESRDDRGFLLDDDLQDAQSEILLGYGRSLADGNLALGGAVKMRHHRLAGYADTGLGLDLGLWLRPLAVAGAQDAGAQSLALGLAVRNAMEPKIKLAEETVADPIALRAGLAWTHRLSPGSHLLALADVEQTRGMDSRLHAGLEACLETVLALRVGMADGRLTAGAGLRWQFLSADYQFEDHPLDSIHRFGVGLAFGPSREQSRQAALAAAEVALQARLDAAFAARNQQQEEHLRQQIQGDLAASRWAEALTGLGSLRVLAPAAADLPALTAAVYGGLARQQEEADDLTGAALNWRRVLASTPEDAAAAAALRRVEAEDDRRSQRSREIRSRWSRALDALAREDLAGARDGFAAVLALAPQDQEAASMLEHAQRALAHRAAAEALAQRPLPAPAVTQSEATQPAQSPRLAATAPAAADLTPARRREIADLYRRGVAAMQANRRAEAVRYWELVWTTDPEHEQVRENLTREYLAQGMEAFAAGELRLAVANWEQALRVDPRDLRARGYLERAQQQLARMEQITGGR